MTEKQRKDRAYLFFFIVGVFVLVLTLFEINQGAEALAMLLVFTWPVSVPLIISMIIMSATATMYSLVTKPKDWPLVVLAIITIPYEIFAVDNVIFFLDLLVVRNITVIAISLAYAMASIGFFILWVLIRRDRFDD